MQGGLLSLAMVLLAGTVRAAPDPVLVLGRPVPGSDGQPAGWVSVDLPVTRFDALFSTIDLGEQKAGNADFIWDGTNEKGEKVDPGTYTFTAKTTVDGKSAEMYTLLPATVNSVTISQTGGELMLNLAGLGSVALSKVQTIGI